MRVGPCPSPRPGGGRCQKRTCRACGLLWAGDTRRRLRANIGAYGGDVALLAVTAPGSDVLPWEDGNRLHVDSEAALAWNSSAPARWSRLHRAARACALRRHGVCTLLGRTWEYQRRGVLHVHPVLGMKTARERAAAHTYALALERLGPRHGFGFVSDTRRGLEAASWRQRGPEAIAPDRAARYVAKYLAPVRGGKLSLTETVLRRDVPRLVVYLSRDLTSQTGVTMRQLRRLRIAHVLGFDPATGETHGSIFLRLARGAVEGGYLAGLLDHPPAGP